MTTKIFTIAPDGGSIDPVHSFDFSRESILEQRLEDWLFARPNALNGSPILWLCRQDSVADGSRVDLTGVDKNGALVVAELKRGSIQPDTITQALRYASAYYESTLDDLLQRIHERPDAAAALKTTVAEHVGEDTKFNNEQRIVLVGSTISPDALAMLRYLSEGASLTPYSLEAYQVEGFRTSSSDRLLSVRQVFPALELIAQIENAREERAAAKYARDPIRMNWMKEFLHFASASGVLFVRHRGQSYEAVALDGSQDETDIWVSVIDRSGQIYLAVEEQYADLLPSHEFGPAERRDDYVYRALRSASVKDGFSEKTAEVLVSEVKRIIPLVAARLNATAASMEKASGHSGQGLQK